jgi:hypothetical protein
MMIDLVELTHTIAEIASKSREPDIAIALMELVDRLLTDAGLPPAPIEDDTQPFDLMPINTHARGSGRGLGMRRPPSSPAAARSAVPAAMTRHRYR